MDNTGLLAAVERILPGRGRIALAGAGGKTTAGYDLARQLAGRGEPVIFTTTTHIWYPDGPDLVVGVGAPDSIALGTAVRAGTRRVIPVLGRKLGNGKLSGFSPVELLHIADLWPNHWLVVEADGSRGRPLKAPGDHEPAIPPLADAVLYVSGLAGIGRPLGPEAVHRPERFGSLAGLGAGETIGARHVARVLLHPAGGRKNIPPAAAYAVLLAGADGPEDFLSGVALARLLAGEEAVLLTGLLAGHVTCRAVFGRSGR